MKKKDRKSFDINLYEPEINIIKVAISVMDYVKQEAIIPYIPQMIIHLIDEKIIPLKTK